MKSQRLGAAWVAARRAKVLSSVGSIIAKCRLHLSEIADETAKRNVSEALDFLEACVAIESAESARRPPKLEIVNYLGLAAQCIEESMQGDPRRLFSAAHLLGMAREAGKQAVARSDRASPKGSAARMIRAQIAADPTSTAAAARRAVLAVSGAKKLDESYVRATVRKAKKPAT